MQQHSFNCQMITPMFSGDADGETPALRAPSFKGAMRFWWRAAQRPPNENCLRDDESEIFGSSNEAFGKSKFIVKTRAVNTSVGKAKPMPHHRNGWCYEGKPGCYYKHKKCQKANPLPCFLASGEFEITLICRSDSIINIAKNTLHLTSILGGNGRRSRRGFGSYFLADDQNLNNLNERVSALLNSLMSADNCEYLIGDLTINSKPYQNIIKAPAMTPRADYPQIKYIAIRQLTKPADEILRIIGEASHNNDSDDLGFAKGRQRLASPAYFSLYKANGNFYLITTLLSSNRGATGIANQEKMIDEVISNV